MLGGISFKPGSSWICWSIDGPSPGCGGSENKNGHNSTASFILFSKRMDLALNTFSALPGPTLPETRQALDEYSYPRYAATTKRLPDGLYTESGTSARKHRTQEACNRRWTVLPNDMLMRRAASPRHFMMKIVATCNVPANEWQAFCIHC